jgi:hypothetical protein
VELVAWGDDEDEEDDWQPGPTTTTAISPNAQQHP